MALTIQDYRPHQCDAVARLWFDSHASAGLSHGADTTVEKLAERLARESRDRWTVRLAMIGEEIAGFLAFNSIEAYLNQLFIAPGFQRRGVGLVLLNYARTQMPEGFRLRTDADNLGARRFYERNGLRMLSIAPHPIYGQLTVTYAWP